MQNTTTPKNPSTSASPKPTHIVHNLEPVKETKVTINFAPILVGIAIIAAGAITGFVLSRGVAASKPGAPLSEGGTTAEGLKKVVGVQDEETFKDSAEGTLREGGTDNGEGTHFLERPGGISQNVYLTSSSVGLDDYIGKKVRVWGETFSAKSAGWLMDVGRLELME